MQTGTVKWFNAARGYGFVRSDDGAELFVHYSAIEMPGYKQLEQGASVSFERVQGTKGLQAINVQIVEDKKDSK